jgi:hypothetical protein
MTQSEDNTDHLRLLCLCRPFQLMPAALFLLQNMRGLGYYLAKKLSLGCVNIGGAAILP